MTNPYAPPPPRKLERSATDRVVSGVCGGVAQYLNMDPTLVRVLTVALTVFTSGAALLVYLIAVFVMPEGRRPGPPPHRPYQVPPPSAAPGPWPRAQEDQVIWGNEGAPWEQPQSATPPPPPRRDEAGPGREPGGPGPL